MSNNIDNTVVGYVHYESEKGMFRIDRACLVAGSTALLRIHLRFRDPRLLDIGHIIKARFGMIASIVEIGGPSSFYVFDLSAYRRFYALAKKAEKSWDLVNPNAVHSNFVHVSIPTNKTSE